MDISHYLNAAFKDQIAHGVDKSTGYYPLDLSYFHDLLLSVIETKDPTVFVDFGSGMGYQVGTAAHYIPECHGFEISSSLANQARHFLQENATHTFGNSHIHNTSYVSEHYLEHVRKDSIQVTRWEEEIGDHSGTKKTLHNVGTKKMPVAYEDIDLFYAYVWKTQVAQVLDIFKRFAKEDATCLLVAGCSDLEAYACASNLELSLDHINVGSFQHYIKAFEVTNPNHTAQRECSSYQRP